MFCITMQIIDILSTHLNQCGVIIGYTVSFQQGLLKVHRNCTMKVWDAQLKVRV